MKVSAQKSSKMLHRLLDSISKDSTAELDFNCVEGVLSISCDIVYSAAALSCVVCAALAAGMTMGLLSLDVMKLRIKMVVGNDAEKVIQNDLSGYMYDNKKIYRILN